MALALGSCGDSPLRNGEGPREVDLEALFAPPTAEERQAVEADWAARHVGAAGVEEEDDWQAEMAGRGVRVRIVSHLVDGLRHVGAVIHPAHDPGAPLPVLVYAHGGDRGVSVDAEVLGLAAGLGLGSADYVIVVPSFRSEALRFGGRSWQSEGEPSPWDGDVDDALALLDVALGLVPYADPERIGVLGLSRGGAVGLLMGIRDPRIDAVVSYFAPTDFFGPFVRGVFSETLEGRPPNLPGIGFLIDRVIGPLRDGARTPVEVRLELLRRSSARFAHRLPAVQIHHGTADAVVPVEEAEHMAAAMAELGRGPPGFEVHLHPGAGHTPAEMPRSFARVRDFLAIHVVEGAPSGP